MFLSVEPRENSRRHRPDKHMCVWERNHPRCVGFCSKLPHAAHTRSGELGYFVHPTRVRDKVNWCRVQNVAKVPGERRGDDPQPPQCSQCGEECRDAAVAGSAQHYNSGSAHFTSGKNLLPYHSNISRCFFRVVTFLFVIDVEFQSQELTSD